MSDRMRPIPIDKLLDGIFSEYFSSGAVFGVSPAFRGDPTRVVPLPGGGAEVPLGSAAGPHTQLCQNIVAAYVGGARFFELKTVQTLDGEALHVEKPCILAEDEGCNVEWSTELTVPQALDEYVKAWFVLKLLSRELGLGSEEGFLFNMSVGYDLAGIRSPKIDGFIEGLKNAAALPVWSDCLEAARAFLPRLHNVDEAYLNTIDPRVCASVTLSTLHGCPPREIEAIASHLLTEKGLHTYVKLNPTLLGYEFCRETLDAMGYDYLVFDERHFLDDLQFEDAVPMLDRLMDLAAAQGRAFGVKLSNTFPVDIVRGELPGGEMYLSGKALYPLALALAERLGRVFSGRLPISFSGGADAFNVRALCAAGIRPVTVATTLLKPGGYQRLSQMAKLLSGLSYPDMVDPAAVTALAKAARTDAHYTKPAKPAAPRKLSAHVPLLDCFTAPCKGGCPIHQDIPEYIRLLGEGRQAEALRVILDRNPLPHITGSICAHPCAAKCTRAFYETPIRIREAKLAAAEGGWKTVLPEIRPLASRPDLKVAVVGGGPAGMAAAFFLARGGAAVSLFELREALGGVVRHIIPQFRISPEAVEADAQLLTQLGVDIRLNTPAPLPEKLFDLGYTHIVLAVGAWSPGELPLEGSPAMNALDFLGRCRAWGALHRRPRRVAVIGGGNTAMDAARAAKRLPGVEDVSIIYRRTRRYMPADLEELELAAKVGVELKELLSPVSWHNGELTCSLLELGEYDASGRRIPVETGETVTIPADLVVAAVGERVDGETLAAYGVASEPRHGLPIVKAGTLESSAPNIYVAGDARRGPSTVVEAIADAAAAAEAILGASPVPHRPLPAGRRGEAMLKKGILQEPRSPRREYERCLECNTLCETCVGVCPNRANVAVVVPTRRMPQIVHIDGLCNECGNCATFCPYDSAPYRDKFTVFGAAADFQQSSNDGFVLLDPIDRLVRVRLDGVTIDTTLMDEDSPLPSGIQELIETIVTDYSYLLY